MKTKKRIKVGIPRISIYNKKGSLIKNFFLYLGCKIILSNESNINLENNLPINMCNYNKSYYEHIISLTNSCDFIIILNKCEYYQICNKYNNFLSILNCHTDSKQLLTINPYKYELIEYLKIGFKITNNPLRIIISYYLAKQKQKKYHLNKMNHEKNKLNNEKIKILLVANYNNIENNNISKYIINKLKENNITTLLSFNIPTKEAILHSTYFEKKIKEKETKKLIGAIYYYRYCIRGIIYLDIDNCKIDKYIINTIKNDIKEIPIISIEGTKTTDNIDTALKTLIDKIN